MKTTKMSLANIQGKLSRAEMKNIIAGLAKPCSMTYQDSGGNWHTETGSCDTAHIITSSTIFAQTGYYQPYCKTSSFSGPVSLSSNGGVSKCGASYSDSFV
jgi:hypothetical protein